MCGRAGPAPRAVENAGRMNDLMLRFGAVARKHRKYSLLRILAVFLFPKTGQNVYKKTGKIFLNKGVDMGYSV